MASGVCQHRAPRVRALWSACANRPHLQAGRSLLLGLTLTWFSVLGLTYLCGPHVVRARKPSGRSSHVAEKHAREYALRGVCPSIGDSD
ncbi:unnamed protein product [Ixodes persulcatus]